MLKTKKVEEADTASKQFKHIEEPTIKVKKPVEKKVEAICQVRIRKEPALDSEVLGVINRGEEITIYELKDGWYKTKDGWTKAEFYI